MKRRTYPAGQRFELLHVETLYRTLDAGLCCGQPVAAGCGVSVLVIDPPDAMRLWLPERNGQLTGDARVLCQAQIDGAPAYGWLLLSWLEPINPQATLFDVAQPTLF